MNTITTKAASTVVCISLLSGCAMTPENQKAMAATFGAVAGGVVTGLATGNVGYGIAGAVGGAALAWSAIKLVEYNSQQVRTPEQDKSLYGFTSATNTVAVKLNKGTASPYTVSPGQQVTVVSDYSLALPASQSMVPVEETYALKKDDKLLFQSPPQTAQRTAGGYAVNAVIPIPADAKPGTYIVESKAQAGSSYDVNQAVFIVK